MRTDVGGCLVGLDRPQGLPHFPAERSLDYYSGPAQGARGHGRPLAVALREMVLEGDREGGFRWAIRTASWAGADWKARCVIPTGAIRTASWAGADRIGGVHMVGTWVDGRESRSGMALQCGFSSTHTVFCPQDSSGL